MARSSILLSTAVILLTSVSFAGDLVRLKNETLRLETSSRQNAPLGNFNTAGPRFLPTLNRVYYILQFDERVKREWKTSLREAGVEFASYLPEDAFIVKIQTSDAWLAVNNSAHVKAVVAFDKSLRVSQELQSAVNDPQAKKIVLKLTQPTETAGFVKQAASMGIPFILDQVSDDILILESRVDNVLRLADIEGVEWVEPYNDFQKMDFDAEVLPDSADQQTDPKDVLAALQKAVEPDYKDLSGYESGTKLMNFDGAYARGLHGEGEIVAEADTGLDRGSLTDILEDFKDRILNAYALGLYSKTWRDYAGHGTHTSGSIVGTGVTSGGRIRGGAFGAKLVMQGLWSPFTGGLSMVPDLENLFGRARRENSAHIHSDSWGSPKLKGVYDIFAAKVDDLMFKYQDLLILFAAGNEGMDRDQDGRIDEGSVTSPGTAKNCLTVGASKNTAPKGGIQVPLKKLKNGAKMWGAEPLFSSTMSDNAQGMAPFSSIGPTEDGRLKPEIVAPGTNILSTRSQVPKASTMWGVYNKSYVFSGGTSMATPLTAGAVAVLRQYLRSIGFEDPSAGLLKAAMISTATDLFPGQFGLGLSQEFKTPRPNIDEGFGRVDVNSATSLKREELFDDTDGLKTGDVKTYRLQVTQGRAVQATLDYTDAAGSPSAQQALVNELDLKIVDDRGQEYFPNHLNGPDHVNTTKMIEFVAPSSGTYDVVITAVSVPKGRGNTELQPYALVMRAAQ